LSKQSLDFCVSHRYQIKVIRTGDGLQTEVTRRRRQNRSRTTERSYQAKTTDRINHRTIIKSLGEDCRQKLEAYLKKLDREDY
jgi:hypothetical protein